MSLLSPEPNWCEMSRFDQSTPLVIGLVNNMPDAALRSTERQFRELLARSDAGRQHVRDNHEDIEELWRAHLDGLIVTGTEPRARDLANEAYWPALTRLVDWADENAIATIWSCLAAHAAVRHLDGIERRALAAKLSGVFESIRIADHPLVSDGPARWYTPHSRYNGLREEELASRGYQVLATSPTAGADIFIKRRKSLLLFLQGHPEYDAGALLREYRRDVGRFLAGQSDRYPEMPSGYFGDRAREALLAFRERALRERDIVLLPLFPMVAAQQDLCSSWRPAALNLYANWLSTLAEGYPWRAGLISRRHPSPPARGLPPYTASSEQMAPEMAEVPAK
jgi:homoserine O-succinyltransferase